MNESMPDPLVDPAAGEERADEAREARKKAMDFLARREHSRAELLEKLVRAGLDRKIAAEAIDRLAGEGLQDDLRYVEAFLQSRIRQGKGPVRIRLELDGKGIDPGLVDEQFADCREDWVALARSVREKKFGPGPPSGYREKAKQMRFLQYRGFEAEQIQTAVGPDE
jgi:regulatory protein